MAQDSEACKNPHFRIHDLRSTYATRISAGGVADEWITHLLRPGDANVFKKSSQMKLQMSPEALEKITRQANKAKGFDTLLTRFEAENWPWKRWSYPKVV